MRQPLWIGFGTLWMASMSRSAFSLQQWPSGCACPSFWLLKTIVPHLSWCSLKKCVFRDLRARRKAWLEMRLWGWGREKSRKESSSGSSKWHSVYWWFLWWNSHSNSKAQVESNPAFAVNRLQSILYIAIKESSQCQKDESVRLSEGTDKSLKTSLANRAEVISTSISFVSWAKNSSTYLNDTHESKSHEQIILSQ